MKVPSYFYIEATSCKGVGIRTIINQVSEFQFTIQYQDLTKFIPMTQVRSLQQALVYLAGYSLGWL